VTDGQTDGQNCDG